MFESPAAGILLALVGPLGATRSGSDVPGLEMVRSVPPAVMEPSKRLPLTSLPEPATLFVVGAGIVGLAIFSRRKKNGS